MKIKRFVGGNLESNAYIIFQRGGKKCWIIDSGYNAKAIADFINQEGLSPMGILLTHRHHDHIGAVQQLKDIFDCPAYIHREDMDACIDIIDFPIEDQDTFALEDEELVALHTPGHTAGSVCFYSEKNKVVFTGDTIFNTDLGRTDLESGSESQLKESCCQVIDRWTNDVVIYPGHYESCNMKFVRAFNHEFKEAVKLDIKMIALDLDGTTLTNNKELTQKTRNALSLAIDKGIHVVIATGRTLSSIPEQVTAFPGLEYIITGNGAAVNRLKDKKVIYSNFIAPAVIEHIIHVLKKENFMAEVFTGGHAYIQRSLLETLAKKNFKESHIEYIRETRIAQEDILDFMIQNKDKIENINLLFEDQAERARMRQVIEKLDGITITSSFDHNIEVGGETTSKADGLKFLLKKLGLTRENLMACGDSYNDIDMLNLAKLPVAMGNAKPEVKEIAKVVTTSNVEDGVAHAIGRFVL